ncbi:hypothetical protein H1Q59_06940 [Holosporaceae bacterium 'Namur']|nr:hypothetical protein [Holosporaceae bacterium 'Namur']
MRGVRRVVGDHTITSVVDVLSDVISGNIDISQYWDLFNYINYQESLSARTNLSERERFYLGYKNHYRTKAINHKEEMLSRDRNRLEDSYILKLKKYKRGLLSDEVLSEIVKCQLEEIIGLYDIRRKHSRLHIITFGELSVEEIKERIKRIIHLAPEIEECINELKSGIRVNSSPSTRVALYDVMDSPTMREGAVDTLQGSRERVLSSFTCSFNSLFHGRKEELNQLETARIYFEYQTIEGRVANVYLDIKPDIQKLYNEKFFDINGQNKILWLKELLENNPQAIMNAVLTNRDGERLELNSIVLNLPRFNSDQLISYISEWIKYGFGKVSKPGPYNIMHSNRGAVEFSSLFKGAMGELRELKGARIYFEYEEQDTKKTLYLDAEPDIKRLYNEGHFDHAGHNRIEWLRGLLQRNSQAIKDAYITNNEGCPIEIEGVTLNFPISSDILVNYISEWIRYAFTNNNKPRGFNNHNPELTREAEERSNTGLRFKDLFRGPEEELRKLKTKDIHFYYRVEGGNTLNYLYLNINPDLKKLYNEGHFDFYGENRIEWLRSQLIKDHRFIQNVEIKDGSNEAITPGSNERGLINLSLVRTCLPKDINDPVIRYITDWIKYGFDTSRNKPGEFSERYASRISPINNRAQFRSAVSPMDLEEQREDRGSRGI